MSTEENATDVKLSVIFGANQNGLHTEGVAFKRKKPKKSQETFTGQGGCLQTVRAILISADIYAS